MARGTEAAMSDMALCVGRGNSRCGGWYNDRQNVSRYKMPIGSSMGFSKTGDQA